MNSALFVWHCSVLELLENPPTICGLTPRLLHPSVHTFPSCFFAFSVHRRLSVPPSPLLFERPAPTAARAPNTTTITAVLPKNKRESVRHHPLDLFHTRAPTSVPDGVAFFSGFLSTPRVLQNGRPPPPRAHYSAAPHPPAPPPRARGQGTSPLYPTPVGSPIKFIYHSFFFFYWVLFSDAPQAVRIPKKEGQTYNLSLG